MAADRAVDVAKEAGDEVGYVQALKTKTVVLAKSGSVEKAKPFAQFLMRQYKINMFSVINRAEGKYH